MEIPETNKTYSHKLHYNNTSPQFCTGVRNVSQNQRQNILNCSLQQHTSITQADYVWLSDRLATSDHISPVLRQLHWLPVQQRILFKIVTLVYRSLSSHAPGYLADDCQLVNDVCARPLCSADTRTLTVHRTSRDRTFAAAAVRVWNSLPSNLRKAVIILPV